jgi:hypothetical protein
MATGESGVPDILAGRADVAAIDNPLIYAYLQKYPQLKSVPDAATCIDHPDVSTKIALGTTKADTVFDNFLTQLYTDMAATIKADMTKYSQPPYVNTGEPSPSASST